MRSSKRSARLDIEVDVNRDVVGGLLPAAHMLVDAGGDQPVGGLWRHQDMVDADAVVLLPSARLVIPEREGTGTVAPQPGDDEPSEAVARIAADGRPSLVPLARELDAQRLETTLTPGARK